MQVKYILYLAILVLLEREFGVSGKNVTKNTVTQNAKVENVTTRSVSKKAKTYSNNNKRKQQYNVQIIAEPDQSYLDRYKKKNYLPSNIITKANFTKNDYDNMLNDPKFDKKYVKKKRKKTPSSVDIYYGSSTTVAPGAPFIESTPQNDISPSFLNHMLSIHESTTKKPSKSEKDYYKYLVDDNYNKYPYRLVTEQTVSSSTTRPTTISRPNVLYFSTTTTTTSSPTSLLNTYGSTIRPYYPLPTYQSATVEDSIKRPTTATSPLSVTTPVIDLNDVVLKLLKNDTNKTMLKDLLQLNCTTPPATKKNPVKQLDEDEGIDVVTEITSNTFTKDNYVLLKPLVDELIANQSTDRKKGVAIFDIKSAEEEKEHDESDEEEEDDFSLDDIPGIDKFAQIFEKIYDFVDLTITDYELVEVKGDKKKEKKDKKHDKKKTTKKKKHKKKKEHHHHEKKKKKKKHHHHDYDYKKKVKKGMKDVLDEFQGAAELIYDMIFNPFDLKPDKKVVG